MVGDRKRAALTATIKDVTDKAGVLVAAALTIAGAALLIACIALVGVLKLRPARAG
jgi:hypothetical protein